MSLSFLGIGIGKAGDVTLVKFMGLDQEDEVTMMAGNVSLK